MNKKTNHLKFNWLVFIFVPRTGLEPAHPCEY